MFPVDLGPAPLFLGFALGMRHALDADHVVAMSTIVTRERSIARAALLGGVWGAGHSLSLLAVGLIVIVFRIPLHPTVEIVFERLVGAMLVVLGLASLFLRHRHPSKGEPPRPGAGRRRPFGVGVMHGLAGSGALTLAVLSTIPSRVDGLLYLALFGLGAVGGMTGVTSLLAIPARVGRGLGRDAASWVSTAAGVLSVAFGFLYLTRWA